MTLVLENMVLMYKVFAPFHNEMFMTLYHCPYVTFSQVIISALPFGI